MLWATHQRLAREVMQRLGLRLTSAEYAQLMEGEIAPDKWKDYPHHHSKQVQIKHHILLARRSYLSNDTLDAYFNLGVALHYIQDAYTTYPSHLPKHQEWEQWIENSFIVPESRIEETIQQTVRNRAQQHWCSMLAQQLSNDVHGRDETIKVAVLNGQRKEQGGIASPKVDLYLGFRSSYVVSKSVLGPRNNSQLDAQLAKNMKDYEEELEKSEQECSNLIIDLIMQKQALTAKKVVPNGIISKVKNWLVDRKILSKGTVIRLNYELYLRGTHLEIVRNGYRTSSERMTHEYEDWYSYQIPQLDASKISKILLDLNVVAKELGVNKQELAELLGSNNIPIFSIDDKGIIRRNELDALLNQTPINGISSYTS